VKQAITGEQSGPAYSQAGMRRRSTLVEPSRGRLQPVPSNDVRITAGFWAERQERNALASIVHSERWIERLDWAGNFDRTAAGDNSSPAGREFADSEIYKLLEAMAWESGRTGSADVEERFVALAARVIAAQQPDGYLNTRFGGPGQAPRYSDLEWGHELYCAGHFIQAAVARARTHGYDGVVQAAQRLADHICETFGANGRQAVCGHPEIETALVELSRVTGDRRYLEQARLFVERRGHGSLAAGEIGSEYFLDDVPTRQATVLRGHAVRATYFAAGAVDVAVETGDEDLLAAVEEQWDRTVAARTYLTGGMGSRHEGESFGADFELPSERAYSETCAGIGSIMLSWRLLLARGAMRYSDLIERTLFNVVATSPDERGTAFFYVNPLQRSVPGLPAALDRPSERAAASQRAPWFEVSCCPTNTARTLASLGSYIATVDDTGLQLHQYASARITTVLADGRTISLDVKTDYPNDGVVVVKVLDAPEGQWALTLRVPSWATGATVVGDGAVSNSGHSVAITDLDAGDSVTLTLPIEPRFTVPDRRIDEVRDCIAVEAGPLVYCAEILNDSADLALLRVDASTELMRGPGDSVFLHATSDAAPLLPWPYSAVSSTVHEPEKSLELELIPYHRWAERGPSTMRVWMPIHHRDSTTTS